MADGRKCEQCGREFRFPSGLRKHLDRKTPCALIVTQAPPDPNTCRFCGRTYSRADTLLRHIRTTCKIAPNERNGEKGMDLLYEHVKRQQTELEGLKGELAEMKAQLVVAPDAGAGGIQAAGAGNVQVAGNNNQVVQQDNRVNILVFGQESTAHLTHGAVKRLLDEAKAMESGPGAQLALLRAAEEIFSSRKHPENLTCFLPNKKTKEALVHGTEGWEVRPEAAILPAIAQRSHTALFDAQPLPHLEGCEGMRDHRDYVHIFRELLDNEAAYSQGVLGLHEMLVRNKTLVAQVLGSLPRIDPPAPPAPGKAATQPAPVE